MKTVFSEKKAKASYKGYGIHIYDVKNHDGKWYCSITITTPFNAPCVDDIRIFPSFDCPTDEEAVALAKEYSEQWIEKHHF